MTSEKRPTPYGLYSVLCILAELVLYSVLIAWQPHSMLARLTLLVLPVVGVILGMRGRLRKDARPWLAAVGQVLNALILVVVCMLLYVSRQ
jgi:hypothetical protein